MNDSLKKIIRLMGKTGDRCIIFDNPNDDAYVIMTFDEYEALVEKKEEISQLTEKQFLDRINREISVWKSVQQDENFSDEFIHAKKDSTERESLKKDINDDVYYFEPID